MARPSVEALEMAAEWLDCYEHDAEDPRHCHDVAKWLREQAEAKAKREAETVAIREHAANLGVSPAKVRRALAVTRKAKRERTLTPGK